MAAELFVADTGADAIFGYPLEDGFPASSPVTTLQLRYAPRQIAVAGDGIYVESQYDQRVKVYALHANGYAVPIREVDLDAPPTAIASDLSGYLYVSKRGGTVDIFGPGANGHAKPVGQVSLGISYAYIRALALDEGRRLYISADVGSAAEIFEYAKPLTPSPVFIRGLSTDLRPAVEMAIDPTEELYTVDVGLTLAFEPTACCRYPWDRELRMLSVSSNPVAIALFGQHAFLVTYSPSMASAIYTVDMLVGAQVPLASVAGANLKQPAFAVTAP